MKAPQITMIVFLALEFGIVLAKNGEPRNTNYSIGMTSVTIAVVLAILIWGGFFDGSAS